MVIIMKSKIIKRVVGICSAGLAVVIGVNAILGSVLSVEAAETLYGIEKLIRQVQEREDPYRILEIVPDETAAEIGYLVPGYEPAVSTRNDDGTWTNWEAGLRNYEAREDRFAYVEGLNEALQNFYAVRGIDGNAVGPVSYEEYEESDTPQDGYKELIFDLQMIRGYFEKLAADAQEETRYDLDFTYTANLNNPASLENITEQYYYVSDAYAITYRDLYTLPEYTYLYKRNMQNYGNYYFEKAITVGDLRKTVSGGDPIVADVSANETVSDGDITSLYYVITMTRWTEDVTAEIAPYPDLYKVSKCVKSETGEYKFVKTEDGYEYPFATNTVYYRGGFINNEWFRQSVINMEPEDVETFPIEVITLTAAELAAMGTIPAYDMLYLNSGLQALPQESAVYSLENDITAEMRDQLFVEVVSKAKPVIVDARILYSGVIGTRTAWADTEIYRLSAMFLQNSPSEFYHAYYDDAQAAELPNVDTLLAGIKADEDMNFVTEQAFSYWKGQLTIEEQIIDEIIVDVLFNVPNIYVEGQDNLLFPGFEDVLEEINKDNQNRQADSAQRPLLPTDISCATVIRHIMNYQNRRTIEVKNELRVLEIQPCKVETPDLTADDVLQWAGVNLDDTTTERPTVTIETITTAEFIGRIEDINEAYDLVYIGTDKDHLNVDGNGNTVFNDDNMNGLVYFHTGDIRYTSIELAGQLDTEYANKDTGLLYYYNPVRYGGNDITPEKVTALMDFLYASYPVVVSDDCFNNDKVTIYQDVNYGLLGVELEPGKYNSAALANLGFVVNGSVEETSSIKVPAGYRVTAYTEDNFAGASVVYTQDTNWVGNDWNDTFASFIVEKIASTVNTTHIDNSSYIYDFLTQAEDMANFYTRSEVEEDANMFNFYLNRPKVSFTNVVVTGQNNHANEDNKEVYVLAQNGTGKYLLEYGFTILNEGAASANTQYKCELFVDVNADGRFSENERLDDISIKYNDETVGANELYAERQYVLQRNVPDGYVGVLPWKIQVTQVENPYVHNGITGYSKVPIPEKEILKILQICRDAVGNNDNVFNLADAAATDGNIYHELIYGGEYDGETFAGISGEYDIQITFRDITNFQNDYNNGTINLDDYNMLILGFSDMYGTLQGEPLNAVVDFIDSGQSVLFAHDTVSYFNYEPTYNANGVQQKEQGVTIRGNLNSLAPEQQNNNSYYLSQAVRDMVGMDKYGVTTTALLKQGNDLNLNAVAGQLNPEKDVAYKPGTNKTESYGLTHGYTYTVINGRDIKANQNNASGNHPTFTQAETGVEGGFTNEYLNLKFGTDDNPNVSYAPNVGDDGELYAYRTNGEVRGLWVTKVNDGQITNYPYKLEDEFPVANTHGQYYQLDFMEDEDGDDKSDLVVWYCLGHRVGTGGNRLETIYSASPNDVANNYYIYNKGNITYTGVGHSDPDNSVAEAKLFINTMIASYNAGIKSPTIRTLSEGSADASEIDCYYRYHDYTDASVYFDDQGNQQAADAKERIYFTVEDPNIVNGTRQISLNCYATLTVGADGSTVPSDPLDVKIYNANTNDEVNGDKGLVSGGIYYLEIDRATVSTKPIYSVYFEVFSTVTVYNRVTITDPTYHNFDFIKVQMFDLQ